MTNRQDSQQLISVRVSFSFISIFALEAHFHSTMCSFVSLLHAVLVIGILSSAIADNPSTELNLTVLETARDIRGTSIANALRSAVTSNTLTQYQAELLAGSVVEAHQQQQEADTSQTTKAVRRLASQLTLENVLWFSGALLTIGSMVSFFCIQVMC